MEEQPGDVIAVIDSERAGQPSAVKRFSIGEKQNTAVEWLGWATGSRLLVGVKVGVQPGRLSADRRPRVIGTQVYSVNIDGSDPVVLFADSTNVRRHAVDLARIIEQPAGDPQHVIMPAWTGNSYDLFRVNVFTGAATRIEKGTRRTYWWATEDGRAVLRGDANRRGTVVSIYGRAGEQEDWSLLTRYNRGSEALDWEYAGDAPGAQIYARARADGADTQGIHLFDIATSALGELIVSVPGFDMQSVLSVDGKYAGAGYVADRLTYVLADADQQRHLNGIDAYFRHEANVNIIAIDRTGSRMLLHVLGPKAPGDYYLYDFARKDLKFLMSERPWLEPERLAPMEARRTPARDGNAITSYLTWPEGSRTGLALVVMPHGGPEWRDSITFEPIAQAFAAQGWLVLQPNFRGSAGYGKSFAQAGYRQWSRRMQDDVTDAVNDLVRSGIVDRARIAIVGASYGGYAALAGAVVTPDLYRAAASMAGVSDLMELLAWQRRQEGEDSKAYAHSIELIGDPKTDFAALRQASPRLRAAEIKAPVLLIHGTHDDIVPPEQSELMQRAMKEAGKNARLVLFDEGHGDWSSENQISSTNEIISFFRPHLSRSEFAPGASGN